VWIVLAALLAAGSGAADRQSRVVPMPAGKTVVVEVTIGTVLIEGSDRQDAEVVVEREMRSGTDPARLPITIEDTASRLSIRGVQADGGTDPALRADVTLRLPRATVVERVRVLEGRIVITSFSGTIDADIRRGPIEGRQVSGTLRLETGIGSVSLANAKLAPDGLLRLRAFNGDVRLSLSERPPDARIMALALNGTIASEIPLTMRDTWGPRWGETTLGKGEPVVSIDVVTGKVDIRSPN
jgi:hypothetical protein